MKKQTLIFMLILVLLSVTARAQLTPENTLSIISDDSLLRIEKIYAGFLPETLLDIYPDSSRNARVSASIRVGGEVSLSLLKNFSFHTLGMYEMSTDTNTAMTEVYLKYDYTRFALKTGYMATSSTLMRPEPLSGLGQFEPETYQKIPGAALGASLSYDYDLSGVLFKAQTGAYLRDDMPEYHFTISCIDDSAFSGTLTIYYSSYNKAFGNAGKMQIYLLPYVRADIVYSVRTATKDPREFGEKGNTHVYSALSFGEKLSNTFYCDYGKEQTYLTPKLKGAIENQSRLEVGYTRVLMTKHMKVMLGGGYRRDERSAVFYCMFYL